MKRTLLLLSIFILLVGATGCGTAVSTSTPTDSPAGEIPTLPTEPPAQETAVPDAGSDSSYKDLTLTIDDRPVTLVNGVSEVEAAPGSASKIVTQFFGNEATGDLNGDGNDDVAFLVTQSGGGSGTFFFIVAALKTESGYQGTNAVLLGDRIAPQPSQIENGVIIVNYADRKPDEPMTAQPSVGVSKYLQVVDGNLVESENPQP